MNDKYKKLIDLCNKLNEKQISKILTEVEFELFPDNNKEQFETQKINVLKKYSEDISNLIAEVEVYSHELPIEIRFDIEMLFNLLFLVENSDKNSEKQALYEAIQKYEVFMENRLYYYLSRIYLKQLKQFHKTFLKFNNGSFKFHNEIFVVYLKKEIKEISKIIRKNKKTISLMFQNDLKNSEIQNMFFISYKEIEKQQDLYISYNRSKECNEKCENYYPKIIECGYTSSITEKLFDILLWLMSFALSIIGVIMIINKLL